MVDEATSIERAEEMLRYDAREALRRARQFLERPVDSQDSVEYQRWLLVKGAAQARLGETEDGGRIIREVRGWAYARGEDTLLALSHRRLSALFRRIGDPALMLEHAVTAVDLLDEESEVWIRADHLLGLADALGASASYDESIARYREAERLVEACDDRYLRLAVLNNLAYTLHEAGRADEAVAAAEYLREEATRDGQPLLRHVGDTIASAYIGVGRYDEAVAVLEPLCRDVDGGEDCDGVVMGQLTLAAVRRFQGRFDDARAHLDRARELIDQYALAGLAIQLLREQSELWAALGEYREAYETFREYHEAEGRLRAVERDARARTLNAIFEATEARRRSDHFRELSIRDPLTGLHNRRHLDSVLTDVLAAVAEGRGRLTVGLVDLDHFKRINDARSHAVGDEVLRRVASILEEEAGRVADGLAVRMGGEEFLVLLPDVDHGAAVELLEQLRRTIASHSWSEVTAGIPVTASIGVASAPRDAVDRRTLLEAADANLYRAKSAGRDRVVAVFDQLADA
jgi:two-component system, cell cycle response regulator